jgi:FtsZ-interacting cell division protein ZipA
MFLTDLNNASFSRRMDREGWTVDQNLNLVKNDIGNRGLIGAHESFRSGKTKPKYYPKPDASIARIKGRTKFDKNVYNNTGRPTSSSRYPKKLQEKLTDKLSANNARLYFEKVTKPKPQQTTTTTNPTTPKPPVKTSNKPAKSTRKLINKYTIGAAGLLGATGVGYAGYKYATRNKNKNKR